MRRALALLLWCAAFVLAPAAYAQAPTAPPPAAHTGDNLRVSVLTFAPGETYWQRFGHNALLVENTFTGTNAVYNYGMFDFFQKNFFLNFARGHMVYRLDVDSLGRTLALYASEGRWVRQQVLNLAPAQRLALAQFLDRNAQPDQAEYRYDYFRDNCSTRVRDAVDRIVGGAIAQRLKAEPVGVTYRHEATRLMRPIWPLALGMDAIIGPAGDAPITRWEQAFVPEVFMAALDAQTVNGAPLVASSRYLVADTGQFVAPAEPLRWTWPALAVGSALGLLLAGLARYAPRGFGVVALPLLLVAGLGGLALGAVWVLTEHWVMHANANLWLFSPLAWLLLWPAVSVARRQRPFSRVVAALMALFALAALLPLQANAAWATLWLPIHAGLAYGLLRRY